MQLLTYDRRGHRRLGALTGGRVVDLPDAVGHPAFPTTLEALISRHGGTVLDVARDALVREDLMEFAVPDPRLLAPIVPASIRDFRVGPGRAELYHHLDPRGVIGPDAPVPWPTFTQILDHEAEVACVLGGWGRDLTAAEADECIFGYTLMNDWTARDVERRERAEGVGPARSKDFATSMGPVLVTADEVDPDALELSVWVDGEPVEEIGPLACRFGDLLMEVSRDREVWACDVVAAGPPVEPSTRSPLWLGALVEVSAPGLGTLRNRVGPSGA